MYLLISPQNELAKKLRSIIANDTEYVVVGSNFNDAGNLVFYIIVDSDVY